MGLLNSLLVGSSGLRAANVGIQTTSHNVANAMTPGYHARSPDQVVSAPLRQGSLSLGQGVSVDSIRRASDAFLAMRQLQTAGDAMTSSTLHTALSQVESHFDEATGTSLREALDGVFDALTEATADPSDRGLRIGVIGATSALASTVHRVATGLEHDMEAFEGVVESSFDDVNDKLQQIADLNATLLAAGGGTAAGDLADQRDLLARELAEEIGITARIDGEGMMTVLIGGHAAVSGMEARELSVVAGSGSPPEVHLAVDSGTVEVTGEQGGRVQGYVKAWELADSYLDDLNTFAEDFADMVNTQHAAGYDPSGTAGGDVFTYDPTGAALSLALDSSLEADPDLLAFASTSPALAGDPGNLQALLELRDSGTIGGSTTPEEWLSDLATGVGRDTYAAGQAAETQEALLADLDELDQSLHGVDMDQEAANLIAYQTAYQAAAKVIQASDAMLGVLMGLGS